MDSKQYLFKGKWQTKKEISDSILYRTLPLKGKFFNLRFYGFCETEVEHAVVEKDFKVSITKVLTNKQKEKYIKLNGSYYYFSKMEGIENGK
jgi:hypothetical protein